MPTARTKNLAAALTALMVTSTMASQASATDRGFTVKPVKQQSRFNGGGKGVALGLAAGIGGAILGAAIANAQPRGYGESRYQEEPRYRPRAMASAPSAPTRPTTRIASRSRSAASIPTPAVWSSSAPGRSAADGDVASLAQASPLRQAAVTFVSQCMRGAQRPEPKFRTGLLYAKIAMDSAVREWCKNLQLCTALNEGDLTLVQPPSSGLRPITSLPMIGRRCTGIYNARSPHVR